MKYFFRRLWSWLAGAFVLLMGLFLVTREETKQKKHSEISSFDSEISPEVQNEIDDIDNTLDDLP